MARTAARADMVISTNGTWEDAFQFGTVGDLSWSFSGQSFLMDVKGTRDDPTPLLSLSSEAGTIVVDDATQRILHLNVNDDNVAASLPITVNCDPYVYDLVMVDTSVPPIRVVLMSGKIEVEQGVTLE